MIVKVLITSCQPGLVHPKPETKKLKSKSISIGLSFLHLKLVLNSPLTPTSDKHLISPSSITPESNIKFMRIKGNGCKITKPFEYQANSPCKYHRKCIENGVENLKADVTKLQSP